MLAVRIGAFLVVTWGHEGSMCLPPRGSDALKADWQRHVLAVGILSWECSTRQRKSWKRFIQRITAIGRRHRTYEIQVSGMRGGDPVRDMVYVDAVSGNIVAVHPQIHGTSLPSTLRKSEGQHPKTDPEVELCGAGKVASILAACAFNRSRHKFFRDILSFPLEHRLVDNGMDNGKHCPPRKTPTESEMR